MTKVLVTGINGQDGSFLAEYLLELKCDVHGVIRRKSSENNDRIAHVIDRLTIHEGDLTDYPFMTALLKHEQFDVVFNLAAMSFVKYSFDNPVHTFEVNALSVISMLHALEHYSSHTKFYQAGTSELWSGKITPQNEETRFDPQSPYGNSKLAAFHAVKQARDRGLFAVTGILGNHESERRGPEFVTRKITLAVARIKHGLQDKLTLGAIWPERDWGYSKDYVRAMVKMVNTPKPQDFVIGTGSLHTVGDFLKAAWKASGMPEEDMDRCVEHGDSRYTRPNEVRSLCLEPTRAKEVLGWTPSTTFTELVTLMVEHDLELAAKEAAMKAAVFVGV